MKNIIAFSLWGDKNMYWIGALKNIELAERYFPGWICRFYIDKKSNVELISTIKGKNVEVVLVDKNEDYDGMFWRFKASWEPDVDIYLSRDTDSRITEREVEAIKEWLTSDKDFHIMRDHPYHTVPILGGMWGCRNGLMRKIGLQEKIEEWMKNKKNDKKGVDQDFLGDVIYPIVYSTCFEHDPFFKYSNPTHPFPTIRKNKEYVGDIFDENDERHPEYFKLIKDTDL